MRKLVSFDEGLRIDAQTQERYHVPEIVLMEKAGISCVKIFLEVLKKSTEDKNTCACKDQKILVLCGSGNNGGDALVIARELYNLDYNVKVVLLDTPKTESTLLQFKIIKGLGIPYVLLQDGLDSEASLTPLTKELKALSTHDWIIDGIAGIGLKTEFRHKRLISDINECVAPVFCIDIPSGLRCIKHALDINFSACKGVALHNQLKQVVVQAHTTATIGLEKTAMYEAEQRYLCNNIVIAEDVFPKKVVGEAEPEVVLLAREDLNKLLLKPDEFMYKHTRGVLAISAGSIESPGAAILSLLAAQKSCAGLVYGLLDENIRGIVSSQVVSAVTGRALQKIDVLHAMVAGSGWGIREPDALVRLFDRMVPMVLDADALSMLCILEEQNMLPHRKIILTPHIGELRRLFAHVAKQQERFSSVQSTSLGQNSYWWNEAQAVANYFNVIVCAKNSTSILCIPNSTPYVVGGSNPLLATAGSGDILAGIIGSVLAYVYACSKNDEFAEKQAAVIADFFPHIEGYQKKTYPQKDLTLHETQTSSQASTSITPKNTSNDIALLSYATAIGMLIHQEAGAEMSKFQNSGDAGDVISYISQVMWR